MRRTAVGLVPVSPSKSEEFDHPLHGHADAGEAEEGEEARNSHKRHQHDDELVDADEDAGHLECLGGQELGKVLGRGPVEDHREPLDAEQQADGRHQLRRRRRRGQPTGEQLDAQPRERAEDQHAQRRRQRPGQPGVGVELVEGVRGRRGHPAVGEVEDAAGLVGEHQPGGGERVDRPAGDADDDEGEDVHGVHTPQGRRPALRFSATDPRLTVLPRTSRQSVR